MGTGKILPIKSTVGQRVSARRMEQPSAVPGSILAAGLVATALALAAVASAGSNSVRPDEAAANRSEASAALERRIERSGVLMGYEILW
jgi:hypothetical protein